MATKIALTGLGPLALIFVRVTLGASFLCFVLALRGELKPPPRQSWRPLVLMAFVGVVLHQLMQAFALTRTTAMNTGWLIGLTPIWSAALAWYFRGERFGRATALGLAGGLLGAFILVASGSSSSPLPRGHVASGDLLIILSTINWAVFSTMGRETIRSCGPVRTTAFMFALAWGILAPLFLARGDWIEIASLQPSHWAALLFLGIGCSGLGYFLWSVALERVPVTQVASFLTLEPLVTLAAASALLGERIHVSAVLGGLLVVAGMVLVQRAPVRSRP